MTCPTEFELSVYADGELHTGQRELEEHLPHCPSCRAMVAALQAENDTLCQALVQAEPDGLAEAATTRPTHVALLAAVTGLIVATPPAGAWLAAALHQRAPLVVDVTVTTLIDLAVQRLLSFILGGPVMSQLVAWIGVSVVVTGLVLALAGRLLSRAAVPGLVASSVVVAVFLAGSPAGAIEVRHDDSVKVEEEDIPPGLNRKVGLDIPAGETVDDTLVMLGDEVNVAGTVNGDLLVFCQRARISGTVKGNLVVAAKDIEVTGMVEGAMYGASSSNRLGGQVTGNAIMLGANVDLTSAATIGRDALMLARKVRVDGAVGRDLQSFSEKVTLSGSVGRTFNATAKTMELTSTSKVAGDLRSVTGTPEETKIDAAAVIGGKRDVKSDANLESFGEKKRSTGLGWAWSYLRSVLAALLVALFLSQLASSLLVDPFTSTRQTVVNLAVGFCAIVTVPVAAVVVAITVIGIPVAVFLGAAYLMSLYLAGVVVSVAVGRRLLVPRKASLGSFALAAGAGSVIVEGLTRLPWVGTGLQLVVILVGLGALLLRVVEMVRKQAIGFNG